jgi:dolichol-phosphate mannosyltransferase
MTSDKNQDSSRLAQMFFSSPSLPLAGFFATVLLLVQIPAALILLSRLLKGPSRRRPIAPQTPTPEQLGVVSVVVPPSTNAIA